MPSEYRKKELLALLGNCVIAIAFVEKGPYLMMAQEAAERHLAELDWDYPGWKEELK